MIVPLIVFVPMFAELPVVIDVCYYAPFHLALLFQPPFVAVVGCSAAFGICLLHLAMCLLHSFLLVAELVLMFPEVALDYSVCPDF